MRKRTTQTPVDPYGYLYRPILSSFGRLGFLGKPGHGFRAQPHCHGALGQTAAWRYERGGEIENHPSCFCPAPLKRGDAPPTSILLMVVNPATNNPLPSCGRGGQEEAGVCFRGRPPSNPIRDVVGLSAEEAAAGPAHRDTDVELVGVWVVIYISTTPGAPNPGPTAWKPFREKIGPNNRTQQYAIIATGNNM